MGIFLLLEETDHSSPRGQTFNRLWTIKESSCVHWRRIWKGLLLKAATVTQKPPMSRLRSESLLALLALKVFRMREKFDIRLVWLLPPPIPCPHLLSIKSSDRVHIGLSFAYPGKSERQTLPCQTRHFISLSQWGLHFNEMMVDLFLSDPRRQSRKKYVLGNGSKKLGTDTRVEIIISRPCFFSKVDVNFQWEGSFFMGNILQTEFIFSNEQRSKNINVLPEI